MYELAHCFCIVDLSLFFWIAWEKPFRRVWQNYNYTWRLSCRTGSAQEQLHVFEHIEETWKKTNSSRGLLYFAKWNEMMNKSIELKISRLQQADFCVWQAKRRIKRRKCRVSKFKDLYFAKRALRRPWKDLTCLFIFLNAILIYSLTQWWFGR